MKSGLWLGICVAATIGAVVPARSQTIPLPEIRNSADLECGQNRRCTDAEFRNVVMPDLRHQWSQLPNSIRAACVNNHTYPKIEDCILHRTVDWFNEHPNGKAPWLRP